MKNVRKFYCFYAGLKSKRKDRAKASFTVETTFILPLIIAVILTMLFLVIHMYNRSVIYSAVCRGSKQIFYYENEGNDVIEEMCSEALLKDMEGRLVCVEDIKAEVKVTALYVEVSVSGKMKIPEWTIWSREGAGEFWTYNISRKEPRFHVAEFIRNGQQLENIYEEVKEGLSSDGSKIQEGL